MISARNISFTLGEYKIIDNFSINIEGNQLVGILSDDVEFTHHLLRILGGIIPPDEGNIFIDNIDIHNSRGNEIQNLRKHLSFVFHSGGLISNLTILENLNLPFDFYYSRESHTEKYEKIFSLFFEFGLDKKILNERPAVLPQQINKILLFIRAFLINPNLIIYDRPFDYLNIKHKKLIIKKVAKYNESNAVSQIFFNTMDRTMYDLAKICYVVSKNSVLSVGRWEEIIKDNSISVKNVIQNYIGE